MIAPGNVRVQLRVSEDTLRALDKSARKLTMTRSEIVRILASNHLERRATECPGPSIERIGLKVTMPCELLERLKANLGPGESVAGTVEAAIRSIA